MPTVHLAPDTHALRPLTARVARTYLTPDTMQIAVVGDAVRIKFPIEAQGLGEVSVVQLRVPLVAPKDNDD
jgi:hypothetical protein